MSYTPSNDGECRTWLANFIAKLEPIIADFGMVVTDLDVLKNNNLAFGSAVDTFNEAKNEYTAASSAKKDARGGVELILGGVVRRINNHPAMTNEIRSQLGLKAHNLVESVESIGDLTPSVYLESAPGMVTVNWGPNPQNRRLNGKPEGVRSATIFRKIGDGEYMPVAQVTRSPYRDPVSGSAADYTYVVQYRGTTPTDVSKPSIAQTIAARGDLAA